MPKKKYRSTTDKTEKNHPPPSFFSSLLGSRRLLCGRWRRWRREFCVVHGNVLLNLLDLDGESVAWAREGPTERHLHAIRIAIIRIVDLRWVAPERSFSVPHKAQPHARLFIQI